MTTGSKTKSVKPLQNNLYEVHAFIRSCCEPCCFTKDLQFEIELAAEEAFINIVKHGNLAEDSNIVLTCLVDDDGFKITFEDSGSPFNPLQYTKNSDGFGITLILNLVDKTTYQRKAEKNILTLTKILNK